MTKTQTPLIAHVPTALALPGDTLVGVASRLAAARGNAGRESLTVLSHNRNLHEQNAESVYVDYSRIWLHRRISPIASAADVVTAKLLGRRYFHGRTLTPAVEAIAARGEIDAVLVYDGHYGAATLPQWQRVRPKTKVLLYVHNPLSRSYGRAELRNLLSLSDGVIFCAHHLRDAVLQRLDSDSPVPLHVVHNGIDDLFLSADASTVRPGPDEPFEVLFAGRTVAAKGPQLLIQALGQAARRTDRPLRGHIVGSTSYASAKLSHFERRMRAHARATGVDVTFTPFVGRETLLDLFQHASAVCLPSTWPEGLPLTALEAMSTGAPMIVSHSAGMVEACGQAALYAPMGDARGLADAIVTLAQDADQAAERGAVARGRSLDFTWTQADAQLIEIVSKLSG